jgi:hypothetical protein
MLREIITPQSNEHTVHIPSEYINTKVEILVLPFSDSQTAEVQKDKKSIFSKTAGLLHAQNIDPLVWQDEIRSEWNT